MAVPSIAWAQDWPRWLGPDGNGVVPDPPPLKTTFEGQLPIAWKVDLNAGAEGRRDGGSPVIVGGVVYNFNITEAQREVERWVLNVKSKDWRTKASKKLSKSAAAIIEKEGKSSLVWPDRKAFDAWLGTEGFSDGDRTLLASQAHNRESYQVNHLTAHRLDDGAEVWHVQWESAGNQGGKAVHATPSVVAGVIYLVAVDGTLHARKVTDGSKVWQSEVRVQGRYAGANGSPVVHDGRLFIAGTKGQRALSIKDGSQLWHQEVPTEDNTSAIYTDAGGRDVLLVPTVQTKVRPFFGLDPATGEVLWKIDGAGARYMTPVVSDRWLVTIMTKASNKAEQGIHVYDLTATPPSLVFKWPRSREDKEHYLGSQFCNTAIASGDRAWWANDRGVNCLSLKDGSVLWANQDHPSGNCTSVILSGKVLIALAQGKGWALYDAESGKLLHLQNIDATKWDLLTVPALADGRLVIRNDPSLGGMICYDLRTQGEEAP